MGRAPCCDKANVKKGPWSPEEDAKLKSYIEQHGTGGNWIALPPKIGLKRCGKSCRLRWLNYLRPNIKHGGFSEEEDNIICSLYISIGSRWSVIAAQLPGRTDNDIKNYWNTRLKKKLLGKQRKEQQQHAPRNNSVVKQEIINCGVMSGGSSSSSLVVENRTVHEFHHQQQPCWSATMPVVKLGGRFSNDDDYHPTPLDGLNNNNNNLHFPNGTPSTTQQQVYYEDQGQCSFNKEAIGDNNNFVSIASNNYNPQRLIDGFDEFLYGEDMVITDKIIDTPPWDQTSTTIYDPPLVPLFALNNYQPYHMPHED